MRIDEIKEVVFKIVFMETGFTKEEISSPARDIEVVKARDLFISLCRANFLSYPRIAKILNRDHTTVIHSIHKSESDNRFQFLLEKYKDLTKYLDPTPEVKVEIKEEKKKKIFQLKLAGKYGYLHQMYGSKCFICSFDEVVEVHHIIPRHKGGTDDIENLALLCPNHHALADRGMLAVKSRVIPTYSHNPHD